MDEKERTGKEDFTVFRGKRVRFVGLRRIVLINKFNHRYWRLLPSHRYSHAKTRRRVADKSKNTEAPGVVKLAGERRAGGGRGISVDKRNSFCFCSRRIRDKSSPLLFFRGFSTLVGTLSRYNLSFLLATFSFRMDANVTFYIFFLLFFFFF